MRLDTVLAMHDLRAVADYAHKAEDIGFMAQEITNEMLQHFAVEGRPEEIPDKLQAKYDGILDRLTFYHPFQPGQHAARWQKFARAFNG
jgi:hypothetical protein